MVEKQDIYKIAVSVIMIHLMIIFVYEGFAFSSNNPDDSIVNDALNNLIGTSDVSNQIATTGLCLQGTATQEECVAKGCVWDSGQCFNAIEDKSGVDFGFFDVLLSIMKIPLYLGKFLLLLGSVVFFELILSFTLMPLISVPILQFFITITLWVYNMMLIYFIWAFISNWRGQR